MLLAYIEKMNLYRQLLSSMANIPKRHTLIQALPPLNVYTKSVHAYIHFARELQLATQCVHIWHAH